jgi:hypothetical protein
VDNAPPYSAAVLAAGQGYDPRNSPKRGLYPLQKFSLGRILEKRRGEERRRGGRSLG